MHKPELKKYFINSVKPGIAVLLSLIIQLTFLSTTAQTKIKNNLKIRTELIDTVLGNKNISPIVKYNIPGSPPRYSGKTKSVNILPSSAVVLPEVPAFSWSFGCTPTAGAMLAGYYDRTGYPNIYTGPENNGICPLDNSSWGYAVINGYIYPKCPLSATMQGLDGRSERGHFDDYWVDVDNSDPDPYLTNGWIQHEHSDCTADFMKTSQSAYDNIDGSTALYFYPNGNRFSVDLNDDGAFGMKLFFESRGYSVLQWYTQTLIGYNGNIGGFSYSDYVNEIDAGRPVLLHLTGHSVLGVGYDIDTETVYFHNTWDYDTYAMDWGGDYEGMQLLFVSVFQLEQNIICNSPTNLAANNITSTTVELTWDSDSNENNFEILYGEEGFNLNEGTLILAESANNKELNGLNAETNYTCYIRQICQGNNSEWSSPLSFTTTALQQVEFNQGWNIISLRLTPEVENLKDILQPLIDDGKLIKVMDESGNVIEDWGIYGSWQNSIGNLQNTEGYKIKIASPTSFQVEGIPVQFPFVIDLYAGWNIISWPSVNEQNGLDVFQELVNDGKLHKIMDESGLVIEDWGVYGGWQNNIGNLKPGKGYKVNVRNNCLLTINEYGTKSENINARLETSDYFIPAFKGNGIDHMTINLVNLVQSGISEGDEIGIFDGDICVGSALINDTFIKVNKISIPVSAADNIDDKNGYFDGSPVSIKLFRHGLEYIVPFEILNGTHAIFEKGSTTFVQLSLVTAIEKFDKVDLTDVKCFPNPFKKEITIEINLKKNAEVQLDIFSQFGQKVKTILEKEKLAAGLHTYKWDGSLHKQPASSGLYSLKISTDGSIYYQKILLTK